MKHFWRLSPLFLALFTACSHSPKKGVSHYDAYEGVKVDQMLGNNISGAVFQKVVICLNGRRETREVHAITNIAISTVTNAQLVAVTNQTISVATNFLFTTMTNLASATPGPGGTPAAPGEPEAVAVETNTVLAVTNPAPALSTNVTFSVARNQSSTASPNQASANQQQVKTYNNQLTTTSNNLTVALLTNLMVTAETNLNVTYLTNTRLATVTNVTVVPTNFLARDYYIFLEYTPPADFTLQSGESMILLVDGQRYGLVSGPLTAGHTARRGFNSVFYRVYPEALVEIANAKEVKLRLKGTSSTIEREMSHSSQRNFKEFLLRYFSTEDAPSADKQMAGGTHADVQVR